MTGSRKRRRSLGPAVGVATAGLDIITVSRRLGHAKPSITLDVYGHLFPSTDDRAAEIIGAALRGRKE